ncbi:MAG: hypothetical protein IPI11_18560 [Haliscomenobacter sp.]|nr:hypothetical protein [Haliscomenobacter sp.]
MEKYFCLPFLFILCFINAVQALDGRLHLMTRNFGHPTLRTWAIENAALLKPYQKGLDLMGLENQAEGPLLAAADSLSNAHGWLTFDYRLYGHHLHLYSG